MASENTVSYCVSAIAQCESLPCCVNNSVLGPVRPFSILFCARQSRCGMIVGAEQSFRCIWPCVPFIPISFERGVEPAIFRTMFFVMTYFCKHIVSLRARRTTQSGSIANIGIPTLFRIPGTMCLRPRNMALTDTRAIFSGEASTPMS